MTTVALVLLAMFAGLVGQALILKRAPTRSRGPGGVGQQARRAMVLRDTIPDDLLERVDRLAGILAVLGRPAEEYVDELKREPDPLGVLDLWERVAAALVAFAAHRELSDGERREAALILRLRSMTDEAGTRGKVDPVLLTAADVDLLMAIWASGEG